jgi:hypothetical protein
VDLDHGSGMIQVKLLLRQVLSVGRIQRSSKQQAYKE